MIFTPAEYLAYIGNEVPAERYYDIALEQLKQICPSFTTTDLAEEDMAIVKKAVMLQLDYYYTNYDAIKGFVNNFSIGKFSMSEGNGNSRNTSNATISPFSSEAMLMLNKVFVCTLWLIKEEELCL